MEIRIIENFFEILIIVFEISLPEVCNLVKNWYIFLIFQQNFNVCISSKLSGITERVRRVESYRPQKKICPF